TGVGIPSAAVEEPQLLLVLGYAIGIIDVRAGQEAQHVCGGRLDHGIELSFAENVVARELDLPHRRLDPPGDPIDEVAPAVAAVDDFRRHTDIITSDVPVGLQDAADIRLHRSTLQAAARPGFYRCGKISILYFPVAFEGDAIEYGRFRHVHGQPFVDALDRNLVEQACCDQRFQCRVARGLIEPPVG